MTQNLNQDNLDPNIDEGLKALIEGSLSEKKAQNLNKLLNTNTEQRKIASEQYLTHLKLSSYSQQKRSARNITEKILNPVTKENSSSSRISKKSKRISINKNKRKHTPKRNKIVYWIAAAAILFLSFGLQIGNIQKSKNTPTVIHLDGLATITHKNSEQLPLKIGQKFKPSDLIELSRKSNLHLSYEDGTILKLSENSVIQNISQNSYFSFFTSSSKKIDIKKGKLLAEVKKQNNTMSFHSQFCVATILGTTISYEATNDMASISVIEGRVQVSHPKGENIILNSGESIIATLDKLQKNIDSHTNGILNISNPQQLDLNTDLISYFKMNQVNNVELTNHTDSHISAKIHGNIKSLRDESNNRDAIQINDIDQYIKIEGDLNFKNISFSFWTKHIGNSLCQTVFRKGSKKFDQKGDFSLYFPSPGVIAFQLNHEKLNKRNGKPIAHPWIVTYSYEPDLLHKWSHIVLNMNHLGIELFINNAKIIDRKWPINMQNSEILSNEHPFTLGELLFEIGQDNFTFSSDLWLDDFRIYSSTCDISKISKIYQESIKK